MRKEKSDLKKYSEIFENGHFKNVQNGFSEITFVFLFFLHFVSIMKITIIHSWVYYQNRSHGKILIWDLICRNNCLRFWIYFNVDVFITNKAVMAKLLCVV